MAQLEMLKSCCWLTRRLDKVDIGRGSKAKAALDVLGNLLVSERKQRMFSLQFNDGFVPRREKDLTH